MKPLFLLLLGLTLLVPAPHAQDDDAKYDEYADEMEIMRSLSIEGWAHAPALPVHASTSKGPTIADFARAFLKQKRYSSSFSRAILARLDGLHPEPDDGMFRYLIDVPHGYLSVDTPFNCGADCTISLEICYWHTANGHRLVGLTWGDRGIGCLLFYDYNPQTRLMTPLPEPPIKDFYDNTAMLNAHLPRQGKDIHIKPIWDNPSDTLTLRWNGSDAFIFDGAAERYRKPTKSNEVALFARAYFYQTPNMPDLSAMKDAPLYDAPNGIITRRLTPAEQQEYFIMLTCVRGDWAEIAYIQPGDRYPVDLTRSLRQGRDYATGFRRAWVPRRALFVDIADKDGPFDLMLHLYAEPTLPPPPPPPRAASMRWRTCETASRWRSHFTSWKPATAGSRYKWPPPTTSAG
jgi:hypothetical protein